MRIYSLRPSDDDATLDAELLRTLRPHGSPVVTSAVDHTGTLLATGGADGVAKVWDIRGGFVTHTFHGHSGVVSALHFFEVQTSGTELGQATKDKRKRKRKQNADTEAEVDDSATLGFRLASGGEDGKIRIWNLHKRNSAAALDSHVSVVRSLSYSPQENALVSGSRDKTVMVWDARTWKIRNTIAVLEEVESAGFLRNGTVVYAGGETGRLRLWAVSSGRELTEEQPAGSETDRIVDVLHYESLPYLLSVQADQTLVVHSTASLQDVPLTETIAPLPILRRISGTHDQIIDMAYVGSDQSMLAIATNLEDIRIVSLADSTPGTGDGTIAGSYFGADVALLKGHEDIIICLDVDWSGHWLATGAKDNTARIWRIDPEKNSYTCHATFTGHAESLGAIALPRTPPPAGSPARQNPLDHPPSFLMTGSQDKTIKRWDVPTVQASNRKAARATYTRKAHDKDINALDTSHDSALFASASQDRTVKIWSVEEGEVQGVLRGHRRGVWAVRFAPKDAQTVSIDGSSGPASTSKGLVLTGSGDKTVRIWSLADYSCLLTLEGHTNSVLKVVWLPLPAQQGEGQSNGKRGAQVASAGGDGLVKVWDAGTGELACTLDNHTDRVWALAVKPGSPSSSPAPPNEPAAPDGADDADDASSSPRPPAPAPATLVSGGADAVLTFWADTSARTARRAARQQTRRVAQEQQLQNLARAGRAGDAVALALRLDRPARLLGLLAAAADAEALEPGSCTGSADVDAGLAALSDALLWRLLRRARDWNTSARSALVAQRVLAAVVRAYGAERLAGLKGGRGGADEDEDEDGDGDGDGAGAGSLGPGTGPRARARENVGDVLDALRAYTERHYRRVEELVEESYLLEFTLREMDDVGGAGAGLAGAGGGRRGVDGDDGDADVVMVE